jgi:hypothetical protein
MVFGACVKLSDLHEKRATVIAITHALTRKFNSDLQEYLDTPDIAGEKTRNVREKEVVQSHRNFFDSLVVRSPLWGFVTRWDVLRVARRESPTNIHSN